MGRKKKYPEYNADRIRQEYMQAVLDAYQSSSRDGKAVSLRHVADEFDTTVLKVRKVLITVGAYSTEISGEVHDLQEQGKSIVQIQQITGLSRASVQSYLPYSRTIYHAAELSVDAKKCLLYRQRKQAVRELQELFEKWDGKKLDKSVQNKVWEVLVLFENYPFYTVRNKKFCYQVKGRELFIDRKEKAITWSTVMLALQEVLEWEKVGSKINGPRQLGTFGASYLYAIFIRFGLIEDKNIH